VLAKGVERCIEMWRPDEYRQRSAQALDGLNPLSREARRMRLFFSANAFPAELDSAGRVMVPAALMDHAGLDKEVVVVGAQDSLQVWDRTAWAEFNSALTHEIADITDRLGEASS
jgi:MraZ protein